MISKKKNSLLAVLKDGGVAYKAMLGEQISSIGGVDSRCKYEGSFEFGYLHTNNHIKFSCMDSKVIQATIDFTRSTKKSFLI